MENLKKYRISLKFSERDPEQVDVANLLKQLGRKKSAFITKAVKYYLEHNPYPDIPGTNNVLTNLLTENMVRNTLLKMFQSGELNYQQIKKLEINPAQQEKIPVSLTPSVEEAPPSILPEKQNNIAIEKHNKPEAEEKSVDINKEDISSDEDISDMLSMLDAFDD